MKNLATLLVYISILSIVSSTNTLSVLQCRANKCFDDFYACQQDKACVLQYNYLNKCMQNECLSTNTHPIDCYHNCKLNHITNPHLSSYIACTDTFCSNESFFKSCGDAYQTLLKEQNLNSQPWKLFSNELNKCVSKMCSGHKSNKRDLLQCQLKSTVDCSRQHINSFRHISYLNNFYECTSDEIAAKFSESDGMGQDVLNKVLGYLGLSF